MNEIVSYVNLRSSVASIHHPSKGTVLYPKCTHCHFGKSKGLHTARQQGTEYFRYKQRNFIRTLLAASNVKSCFCSRLFAVSDGTTIRDYFLLTSSSRMQYCSNAWLSAFAFKELAILFFSFSLRKQLSREAFASLHAPNHFPVHSIHHTHNKQQHKRINYLSIGLPILFSSWHFMSSFIT
jgi:hypothetical protein